MRMLARRAADARSHLDGRLNVVRVVAHRLQTPPKGWIRAIREALGMTATQLARRMNSTQASVSALERSESNGTVRLATLRRAAEAMDCTLVYAFVPKKPLEEAFQARAAEIAEAQMKLINHTMMLENQGIGAKKRRDRLRDYIRFELDPRTLWDKP